MSNSQNGGFISTIGSGLVLLLKIVIGFFLLPIMGLWQGLKFFRRHVYSQGSWWRDISGAVAGIAGGIMLAYKHVGVNDPNANWWVAGGFATALAIYAYIYPAVFWLVIQPLLPYLRAFLRNTLHFLRLLGVNLWQGICWFLRKFIWAPLHFFCTKIIYPILEFIWEEIFCRGARILRWCWNSFWQIVRVGLENFGRFLKFAWNDVLVPCGEFLWNVILKPLGRLLRYCGQQLWKVICWTWNNLLVPLAKWVWKRLVIPFWSFLCRCARGIRRAFFWTIDQIVVPLIEFIWKQVLCRIGRLIKQCWNGFWHCVGWVFDNLICPTVKFIWEEIICRVLRFIWVEIICRLGRWLNTLWTWLIVKPIQWVWKKILQPILSAVQLFVVKVWTYMSGVFVLCYYSRGTSAELLSHLLGLAIPVGLIAIVIGVAPKIAEIWLVVLFIPALYAIPLAYVWGGKVLRLAMNWLNGFALSFSSAYLIGLCASQFVSVRLSIGIGSAAGILLFFVLYPLAFSFWERHAQGNLIETTLLSIFNRGFARVERMVSVVSNLCIEVWLFIQKTVPDFLYRTWNDTLNWLKRVFHRFGG
ncbi:MAG: hypothetical protein K2X27_05025 [Candidatus Obscuribacterales bacterium]|nr:hypothetical protein [Candidatus Obscuribacterales bacterium]